MEAFEAGAGVPFGMLVDRSADRVLVALTGEFTMQSGQRFEDGVREIEHLPVHVLVVDLSGLTFIDSTAAFLLLQLQHRFEGRATVTFEGGTPRTQALLQTAGFQGGLGESNPDHPPRHPPQIGLPYPELPPHRRKP
jgi:anti-anti-sigma regulatory factor